MIRLVKIRLFVPLLLCAGLLAACGDDASESELSSQPLESAEVLYSKARDLFDEGKFKDAVVAFEEVERQRPYSEWAVHSQVMSGYSSYKVEDYSTAIATLSRFVQLYPSNESTPYAYYLIALCYYEQISDVGRDQKITEQALEALRDVMRRFPDTEYARDAKLKQDLTLDHLAGKEMQVGLYYLKHDDYIAAANRFRTVVENYQTTSHVPEALHRMVEAYLKLGVREEAVRYASVLGHNFPSSPWYRDSYKLLEGEGLAPSGADSSLWDSIIP
jgi:outer membrane protein assembly factor BamD